MDDLNHIQLPASVITELYRSSLIDTGEKTAKPITAPVAEPLTVTPGIKKPAVNKTDDPWKYLGENQKSILIVVDYADAVYLPDEELTFLTNMLTACKLGIADVAIINRKNYPEAGYKEAMAKFKSKTVFLFGIEPAIFEMPLAFPHFQIQNFAGTTFLFAPALEECRTDKLIKSKLWVSLQRIFAI